VSRSAVASKDHVLRRIGKSVIVDTRVPEEYFGATSKQGHIKSAVSLPTPWIFTDEGVFRNERELQRMAEGVLGKNKSKEVILYCDVGGYASTWWFLLTQMLGYQNVKVYDGSIQEWIKDPGAPLTAFSWR
jgi:thiosulfate/3-mercaptopyruvate sulfurtransferase